MRILMINYEFPPLGGGGGVAAKKLAEGFGDLGYTVDYVTTAFRGLPKEEKIDAIHVHRVWVPGRSKKATASLLSLLLFPLFAFPKAYSLCRKNKFLFLNTHFAVPSGILGVWISKLFKLKNILSLHAGDIYDPTKTFSPHRWTLLRWVVRWVLQRSSQVVAQSQNTRINTLSIYHYAGPIPVIPLPYNRIEFPPKSRQVLGLEQDAFYLIAIGRLVKRKRFEDILQAMGKIKNKKVHFLLLGEGPERNSLQLFAEKLKLKERVHLLGFVSEEEKFQYLSKSNIYILSSEHEGFGIVLQEAMQSNLAIIATNQGGQTDLIQDGENGLLIPPGQPEILAQKISYLLEHPEIVASFATRNAEFILQYDRKEIANKYLTLAKNES